jgi:hypothetical protein
MILAKKRFSYSQFGAKKRGVAFLLTFEEWYHWWLQNGVDKNDPSIGGIKRNQLMELCMCRFNDAGPYALNNIYCSTRGQNSKDARKFDPTQSQHRSKPIQTPLGIFPSLTAASVAYGRDKTTIGHRLKKYPSEYFYI